MARQATPGQTIVLPLTITQLAERLAAESGVEIVRTEVSLPAVARAGSKDDVVFAGSLGGGYIFPQFLPAFDAVMSIGRLLELLALDARPLSEHIAEIPDSSLVHRTLGCPWALKGSVMRTATETLQREAQRDGGELSLVDGVRVAREDAWIHLLPDADEPIFHVYAEGADRAQSEHLAETLAGTVRESIRDHGR